MSTDLLEAPSLGDLLAKSKVEVEKLAARMAAGEKPSEVEVKAILQEAGIGLKDLEKEVSFQEMVKWERDRWQAVTDADDALKQMFADREKLKLESEELTAEMNKQYLHRLQQIDWEIRQFNQQLDQLHWARKTAIENANAASEQIRQRRAALGK
jgi:hypothetical protein